MLVTLPGMFVLAAIDALCSGAEPCCCTLREVKKLRMRLACDLFAVAEKPPPPWHWPRRRGGAGTDKRMPGAGSRSSGGGVGSSSLDSASSRKRGRETSDDGRDSNGNNSDRDDGDDNDDSYKERVVLQQDLVALQQAVQKAEKAFKRATDAHAKPLAEADRKPALLAMVQCRTALTLSKASVRKKDSQILLLDAKIERARRTPDQVDQAKRAALKASQDRATWMADKRQEARDQRTRELASKTTGKKPVYYGNDARGIGPCGIGRAGVRGGVRCSVPTSAKLVKHPFDSKRMVDPKTAQWAQWNFEVCCLCPVTRSNVHI